MLKCSGISSGKINWWILIKLLIFIATHQNSQIYNDDICLPFYLLSIQWSGLSVHRFIFPKVLRVYVLFVGICWLRTCTYGHQRVSWSILGKVSVGDLHFHFFVYRPESCGRTWQQALKISVRGGSKIRHWASLGSRGRKRGNAHALSFHHALGGGGVRRHSTHK